MIGHIKEDPNNVNSPNPTGYMRGSREVSWDQRVTQQLDEETEQDSPRPSEGASIKSGSRQPSFSRRSIKRKSVDSAAVDEEQQFQRAPAYSMDDLFTPPSGPQTDPYLLPDRKVADNLINSYFTTFHPSFPIVSKQLFMEQYNTFFETFFPLGSSKRWLAMLNLKFAIGALYLKLVDSKWQGNNTEHLKYFGRARLLCLDERSLFEVADLQQVQVLGLAGMYLLACNQTNR